MLKIYLRITIFIGAIFNAAPVLADDGGLGTAAGKAGLKNPDIPSFIGNVLGKILGYTGIAFFILVVYGGLMWMMSAGNEESVAKAKKILTAAIIGLIIVLSAYAITTFVGNSLG